MNVKLMTKSAHSRRPVAAANIRGDFKPRPKPRAPERSNTTFPEDRYYDGVLALHEAGRELCEQAEGFVSLAPAVTALRTALAATKTACRMYCFPI